MGHLPCTSCDPSDAWDKGRAAALQQDEGREGGEAKEWTKCNSLAAAKKKGRIKIRW